MRLLIVDDSEVVREKLIAIISELGNIEVVAQASDIGEAVAAVTQMEPDAVLLDIRLPGGSGMDIIATIKRHRHQPKVIVLTNYAYPQYREKCMKAGADFFFDKSTEFEKAIDVVKQIALQGQGDASKQGRHRKS